MQEMIRFMVAMLVLTAGGTAFAQEATTYVRYEFNGNVSYGVLEDETIHELRGDIFTAGQRTGNTCDARSSQVADPDGATQGHRGRVQLPQPSG